MLVATLLAAAAVAQACPQPVTPGGPPPCAAANVPGCLPGYHREVDAYGRARYVCDTVAYQPPTAPAQPPPPPPAAVPAPPARYGYAPRYAAPWAAAPAPSRGILGLVLMPGVSSTPYDYAHDGSGAGAVALEVRPDYGGLRLRLSFDGSRDARAAEVAIKYDFLDWTQVRPFLALGVGGGAVDPDPEWRMTASIGGGVDLYVTRDLFFTVELKERAFAARAESAAYGLDTGTLHQTAFFMGVGLYL